MHVGANLPDDIDKIAGRWKPSWENRTNMSQKAPTCQKHRAHSEGWIRLGHRLWPDTARDRKSPLRGSLRQMVRRTGFEPVTF